MPSKKSFFSSQLKKIMFEKNLTQKELAEKLGVGQQMISFWVTAGRNPTVKSITKLAEVLNVPKEYFLGGQTDNTRKELDDIKNKINFIEEKNKRFELEITLLKKDNEFLRNKILSFNPLKK